VQHISERNDHPEPGVHRAPKPAQPEQHAFLVLLHDPHRQPESREHEHGNDENDNYQ
jgi:hypothetical protein